MIKAIRGLVCLALFACAMFLSAEERTAQDQSPAVVADKESAKSEQQPKRGPYCPQALEYSMYSNGVTYYYYQCEQCGVQGCPLTVVAVTQPYDTGGHCGGGMHCQEGTCNDQINVNRNDTTEIKDQDEKILDEIAEGNLPNFYAGDWKFCLPNSAIPVKYVAYCAPDSAKKPVYFCCVDLTLDDAKHLLIGIQAEHDPTKDSNPMLKHWNGLTLKTGKGAYATRGNDRRHRLTPDDDKSSQFYVWSKDHIPW